MDADETRVNSAGVCHDGKKAFSTTDPRSGHECHKADKKENADEKKDVQRKKSTIRNNRFGCWHPGIVVSEGQGRMSSSSVQGPQACSAPLNAENAAAACSYWTMHAGPARRSAYPAAAGAIHEPERDRRTLFLTQQPLLQIRPRPVHPRDVLDLSRNPYRLS